MKRDDFSLMIFPFFFDLMEGKMTMEDIFSLAAKSKIPTVDVIGINRELLPAVQGAVTKTNVQVYCFIDSISFFQPEDQLKADLKESLTVAKELDSKLFMIVPYVTGDELKTAAAEGRSKTLERMVQGFTLAVRLGEDIGLQVCFETTPHDEIALSGTEDCAYVLEHVPGLKLIFDTGNMLSHGDETLEAYEALKPYIAYVHFKDVDFGPSDPHNPVPEHTKDGRFMRGVVWGEGVIPIAEVANRLERDGYQGPYAIEYAHPGVCTEEAHLEQIEKFMKYFHV